MTRIKLELPNTFLFSTEIPLRISDINYGGHLGNDAVLAIVHEARVRFLGSLGYTELDIEGTAIMMTDAIVVYKSEGFYGDILLVEVGVTNFHSVGCDFSFRLKNKITSKEVARAKTGIAFFNRVTRKFAPIPEAFLKQCKL